MADADEWDEADGLSSDAEDAKAERVIAAATAQLPTMREDVSVLLQKMRAIAQQNRNASDAKIRALTA